MSNTPILSDEERALQIEKRRQERRAKRMQQAIDRVAAFRQWVEDDAEITVQRRLADQVGDMMPARPRMPEIPTDHDYALLRENEEA